MKYLEKGAWVLIMIAISNKGADKKKGEDIVSEVDEVGDVEGEGEMEKVAGIALDTVVKVVKDVCTGAECGGSGDEF